MANGQSNLDIGRRLKEVRLSHRLSQRELSRRSGVANATISQIESSHLNPTVSLLKKVLDGLPMSLSEFFSFGVIQHETKVFFSAAELIEISKGGVSYRQVGGKLSNRLIQLLHERYEPGAGTGKHALRHKGEECGIVLSGQLKVTVGEHSRTLKAGDAYYFNSESPHSFRNEGKDDCVLITACTPPSF